MAKLRASGGNERVGHTMGDSLDARYAEIADVFGLISWQEDAALSPT